VGESCVSSPSPSRNRTDDDWWAHQDLNLEPTNYEFAALTN
jgi:hypothetical protein